SDSTTVSNFLSLSLDLAEPFTLEASWQLLDTEAGRYNTFSIGGDIKLSSSFDIDALIDFAPRTAGVRTFGAALTPTYEIDEGFDFYTSFSVPLFATNYDILQSERVRVCALLKRNTANCASRPGVTATADEKVNQLAGGLVVEQGIYDL